MSESWRAGDVALCVDADDAPLCLRLNRTYIVASVGYFRAYGGGEPVVGLLLHGCSNHAQYTDMFAASRFIKQPPLVEQTTTPATEKIDG